MRLHQTVAACLALLAASGVAVTAAAQPAVPPPEAELGPPPPPPGPPAGYVLEPGHWRWGPRVGRYVWVPRHWIATRPGYAHFIPGHWAGGVWVDAHWGG